MVIDMAFEKLTAKVTYVPDREAEVNLQLLLSLLRRIILSDISLAENTPADYNTEEKGTDQ